MSVEDHTQRAMEEGKFKNLQGQGRPLKVDDNAFEDPEWRLANRMLAGSGYSLPWVEKRKEIESNLEKARADLKRTWNWRQEAQVRGVSPEYAEAEWRRAQNRFRETLEELNKRILTYNLQAPSVEFHLLHLKFDREIARLTQPPQSPGG